MSCFVFSPASRISFTHPRPVGKPQTCQRIFTQRNAFLTGQPLSQLLSTVHVFPRPIPKPSRLTMADDSSGPLIRIVSAVLIGGLLLGSFLPLLDVLRNSGTSTADSLIDSQLSRVPVFTVTDETGRPFLSETEDHRLRRGYFFIQPADAERFLQQVKSENPDAKVLAVGLDKAAKFVYSKSTPAKSIPEKFQLFPDDRQVSIARDLTDGAFEKTFGEYGVPIFYIDGLAVKDEKAGTAVYPLFFEKAKLDETLANLKKTDPKSSLNPTDLQVIDLGQTIKEIRAGANPRLSRVVFVPLTDSLEQLKRQNAKPSS